MELSILFRCDFISKEEFSQRHVIIFSIIVAIVFVLIFGFGFPLILFLNLLPNDVFNVVGIDYYLNAINNFIAFIVLIAFLKVLHLYRNISWNFKGIPKGLLLGFLFIVFTITQAYLIYSNAPSKEIFLNWAGIASGIVYCISIALWEELLCRGLILTNMIKKWGHDERGIFKSIILSSIIFGCAHIITGIGADMGASLIQVCYATVMGILLGSIYIKTRSLDAAIALHFILNLPAYLIPYILPVTNGMDGSMFIAVLFIFGIFWIFAAYIIAIRTSKEDCEELINQEISTL